MLRHGPKVAAVDASLADQALVRLGDRLAQVLPGAAKGVAEELDLEIFFFFFFEGEEEEEEEEEKNGG